MAGPWQIATDLPWICNVIADPLQIHCSSPPTLPLFLCAKHGYERKRERGYECACVYERERERGYEGVCVCTRERGREVMSVCVCVCVCVALRVACVSFTG